MQDYNLFCAIRTYINMWLYYSTTAELQAPLLSD